MNITQEEQLMYRVMKAVYDSGIPVSFKGSMVLKACLVEAGYSEETRHTVDIDANWISDAPTTEEQMIVSIQKAIDANDIDLDVSLYRMYGEGRSAGFELKERSTGEILFTMDMDVNRPVPPTKIYEIDGLRFCGVSPIQIIADKISVVSTDKVFRRIKDVVDLYYLSRVFRYDKKDVLLTLKNSGRTLDRFQGFLNRTDELRHSYEKFRFDVDVSKPTYDEVYQSVRSYIKPFLPKERNRDSR